MFARILIPSRLFISWRCFVCAIGLALGSSSALSQGVEASAGLPDQHYPFLQELLSKALAQSPRMLERSFAVERAEGDRVAGRAYVLPRLNAYGRLSYEKITTSGARGSDNQGTYYTVSVSQPLFHWGELNAERELGKISSLLAKKSYAEAYRDLAAGIRSQFLGLIAAKYRLALRRSELAAQESSFQEQKARVAAGVGSNSDLDAAAMGLSEVKLQLEREEFEYEHSLTLLARTCGVSSIESSQIPAALLAPEVDSSRALQLVTYFEQSDARSKLPVVEAQKQNLRRSELRYKIARTRLLPKFDLSASTGLENYTYLSSSSLSQSATRRHSIGITANWTLFDGLSSRAAKMQALSEKRDNEARLSNLLRSLDEDTRAALKRCDLATQGLKLTEARLAREQGALMEAEENARVGRVSATVVVDFRNRLMNAQLNSMSARIEVYNRWNDLVSLLWLDPVLDTLSPQYFTHGN